jgi:hypothetical protein
MGQVYSVLCYINYTFPHLSHHIQYLYTRTHYIHRVISFNIKKSAKKQEIGVNLIC